MALQSTKHGFPFPALPQNISGVPSLLTNTFVLDAADEKAAIVFPASAAKAIRTVHIRTGTVTTGDTVDVRVETVDGAADGDPTGTLHTVNSNASLVINSSDDNVWKSVQLTSDTATLAVGDVLSIVVVNGGGGGNMQIASYGDQSSNFPYGDLFTASWAKQSATPLIIPQYSDGSFETVLGSVDVGGPINTNVFKSDDATNRRGNIFQVAFPCRARGCWVWVDADNAFTVKLYDSDGESVLATTASVNSFQRAGPAGSLHFLPFTTNATLSANTNYRLAAVPSGAANISVYDFDVPAAAMLDMFPGGQSCHASVYTSGSWVETTTRRAYMGVYLDAFSDGLGGGGGSIFGSLVVR